MCTRQQEAAAISTCGDMLMNIDVFDAQAQVVRQIELPDSIFGVEIKEHLLHEMVRYQLAMRRQGTAHTKNRSAVRGGGGASRGGKKGLAVRERAREPLRFGAAGGRCLARCHALMPWACPKRNAARLCVWR